MTMQNNRRNTFDDFYSTLLEEEPQTAYMGAVGRQGFGGTAPMQQRAQDYWSGRYSNIYNQYLGKRAQEISQRKDPSQWSTFGDFLSTVPFTQRYAQLSPYQRGVTTSRYAPSTRHIYF